MKKVIKEVSIEFEHLMNIYGFDRCNCCSYVKEFKNNKIKGICIFIIHNKSNKLVVEKYCQTISGINVRQQEAFDNVLDLISYLDVISNEYNQENSIFNASYMFESNRRQSILAAINTRNLTRNLVRVKSSNVWAYAINIRDRKDKTGDVITQFKGKNGGPGDIYIYYDVPVTLYRRWISAPSKGHFFWQYIRNNFQYSKLTGNKRGVLPNAVNRR